MGCRPVAVVIMLYINMRHEIKKYSSYCLSPLCPPNFNTARKILVHH